MRARLNDEGRELQCSLSEIHCGPVLVRPLATLEALQTGTLGSHATQLA
jgi:hypothetical protein